MQKYIVNTCFPVLLLCLFSIELQAQVLQWSNPTKLRGAAVFTKVIGENEQGVYLLRYRNKYFTKSIIIEKYSHQLSFVESKTIDLKRSRLVKLKLTNGGILVVKSEFDRKSQSNVLLGQYFDFDLNPKGNEVPMKTQVMRELGDRGDFSMRISDDQQQLAVLHTGRSEAGNITVNWILYNSELTLVKEKRIELPYTEDEFIIRSFMVNNDGEIACLGRRSTTINRKLTKFSYSLFLWEGDSIRDFSIGDSIAIKEISLTYDRENNSAVVVGLYGNLLFYGLEGVNIFRYDFTENKSREIRSSFDNKVVRELRIGNDTTETSIPEGFDIIQLVPRSDGGLLLIAEQKDVSTESDIIMVNGIPQSTSKNIYKFNDIVILNMDSTGMIDWSHVIHKNQTTVNDGGYFSSAVVYVNEHFIQMVYNDQMRHSGDVMQYTIYSNGKVMSRKLLKSELDFVVIIPPEALQVSSNKIIIPTSKNRRFALLKMIYD